MEWFLGIVANVKPGALECTIFVLRAFCKATKAQKIFSRRFPSYLFFVAPGRYHCLGQKCEKHPSHPTVYCVITIPPLLFTSRCFWRKGEGRNRNGNNHPSERQSCLRNSEESLAAAAKMQRLKEQGGLDGLGEGVMYSHETKDKD